MGLLNAILIAPGRFLICCCCIEIKHGIMILAVLHFFVGIVIEPNVQPKRNGEIYNRWVTAIADKWRLPMRSSGYTGIIPLARTLRPIFMYGATSLCVCALIQFGAALVENLCILKLAGILTLGHHAAIYGLYCVLGGFCTINNCYHTPIYILLLAVVGFISGCFNFYLIIRFHKVVIVDFLSAVTPEHLDNLQKAPLV